MFNLDDIHQLTDLEVDNQRVFVRADLDVPCHADGSVIDDTKLKAAVPTLRWLLDREALITIGAHLGPMNQAPHPKLSLADCGAHLAAMLETELYMPDENLGAVTEKLLREQRRNHLVLLDNLAFDEGERSADEDYARQLIAPYELYVCDGLFGAVDSASLSVAGKFCQQRAMGLHLRHELARLADLLETPQGKAVWCVGGRFAERRGVLERAAREKATIVVGAELAPPLLAASGKAFPCDARDETQVAAARTFLRQARDAGAELLLPSDVLCRVDGEPLARPVTEVHPKEPLLDLGPASRDRALEAIGNSRATLLLDVLGTETAAAAGLAATREVVSALAGRGDKSLIVNDRALFEGVLRDIDAAQTEELPHVSTSKDGILSALTRRRNPSLEALRIPL